MYGGSGTSPVFESSSRSATRSPSLSATDTRTAASTPSPSPGSAHRPSSRSTRSVAPPPAAARRRPARSSGSRTIARHSWPSAGAASAAVASAAGARREEEHLGRRVGAVGPREQPRGEDGRLVQHEVRARAAEQRRQLAEREVVVGGRRRAHEELGGVARLGRLLRNSLGRQRVVEVGGEEARRRGVPRAAEDAEPTSRTTHRFACRRISRRYPSPLAPDRRAACLGPRSLAG